MKLSEFSYEIPHDLIAKFPAQKRDYSRMMVLNRQNHTISDKHFYDITEYLNENDFLVMNSTGVMPARLFAYKETGAKIEIFLTGKPEGMLGFALIKPSKRVKPGMILKVGETLSVEPVEQIGDKWKVKFHPRENLSEAIYRYGNVPLPPYIEKDRDNEKYRELDTERYATVYAQNDESVAAPTAGLHFTEEILEKLKNKGTGYCFINLNVGLGTFKAVTTENIEEHQMHEEIFEITEEAAKKINEAKNAGKNIVAVGTTSVRALESVMQKYGEIKPVREGTKLFMYPGKKFTIIDKMITNFHMPESTLLMLVSAFAGRDFIMNAYKHAIEEKYRFYSFGDCMLIE